MDGEPQMSRTEVFTRGWTRQEKSIIMELKSLMDWLPTRRICKVRKLTREAYTDGSENLIYPHRL